MAGSAEIHFVGSAAADAVFGHDVRTLGAQQRLCAAFYKTRRFTFAVQDVPIVGPGFCPVPIRKQINEHAMTAPAGLGG